MTGENGIIRVIHPHYSEHSKHSRCSKHLILLITGTACLVLVFSGCFFQSNPISPLESGSTTILFTATGGIGGDFHKLIVDASGVAYDQTIYPILQLQLTRQEHDSLLALFCGFEKYQDSYRYLAMDDFHYTITLRTATGEKTVNADGLALHEYEGLKELEQLVLKLWALEYRVYQEKSTWEGLQYEFSFDRTAYRIGDTITALCRVSNPTSVQRALYFRNMYQLQLSFSSTSQSPHFSSWIPDRATAWGDTSSPNYVLFEPGETKNLSLHWNQWFVNYTGEPHDGLPVGSYQGSIYLLAGPSSNGSYRGAYNIPFEITN